VHKVGNKIECNNMHGERINIIVVALRWILILTTVTTNVINPLNPELNPICYLLALLGAHHFLHVSRIRVKLLNFR